MQAKWWCTYTCCFYLYYIIFNIFRAQILFTF
jgi:hypothetical protein